MKITAKQIRELFPKMGSEIVDGKLTSFEIAWLDASYEQYNKPTKGVFLFQRSNEYSGTFYFHDELSFHLKVFGTRTDEKIICQIGEPKSEDGSPLRSERKKDRIKIRILEAIFEKLAERSEGE